MEWAQYGLDVFRVAIWPAVTVIVLVVLRPQIQSAIDRVEEVTSPWGGSFRLGSKVDSINKKLGHISGAPPPEEEAGARSAARQPPGQVNVGEPGTVNVGADVADQYADSQEGIDLMKTAWNRLRAAMTDAAVRCRIPP